MSARQQRNVQYLLIGATANLSTGAFSSMNTGEIGVFDAAGNRVVESGASTGEVNFTQGMEFYLALGGSSPMKRTPLINGANIKSIGAKAYAAAAQQIDILGFNGTSGSIEVFDNNLYMVRVYLEDFLTSSHDGRYIKHFQYESDASATQAEIAEGLFKSAVYNWQREPKNTSSDPFMVFEMYMATGSDAAVGTSVDNVVFTKGSNTISATDIDDGTGSAAFAVGDFIRIGTGATDEVYKITAIDATNNTATLSVPYQGATQTIADTGLKRITAASAASLNCGIKMTGTAQDHTTGKFFNKVIRWSYELKDFGTTTTTASQAASKGIGVVNEVKDLEHFCAGANGEIYRMGEPGIHEFSSDVDTSVTGSGYDYLDIVWEDTHNTPFVGNASKMRVTLATPATAPDYMTNGTDGVRDVLESIAGTTLIAAGGLDV